MEILVGRCCGVDVHKKMLMVCVRVLEEGTGELRETVAEFGTTTGDLLRLSDMLAQEGVTEVAMESTGVYWKPLWHILEGRFKLLLVNAQHIKHVPGRKTDVKDCQWIAQLLQHGLLQSSFVPQTQQQQWRDLTRLRWQLVARKAQTSNRIQKVLEDANIKLASVASDVLGVSGREMILAIISGEEDAKRLANLARRRLRSKMPELEEALLGRVSEHHRFLLRILMEELEATEKSVGELEKRLEEVMAPFAEEIHRLDTIPGVNIDLARVILAEVGPDMSQYPSAAHLCSWAGMSPGNHQSGGKRKSGKTTRGNRWLRSALVQAGWAGSRKKQSCLASLYGRLASRRGKKRAIVACGASILNSVYYMMSREQEYVDLGANHYEDRNRQRLAKNLVKRLEAQGYKVTLTRAAA